jgi:hypothetical protein
MVWPRSAAPLPLNSPAPMTVNPREDARIDRVPVRVYDVIQAAVAQRDCFAARNKRCTSVAVAARSSCLATRSASAVRYNNPRGNMRASMSLMSALMLSGRASQVSTCSAASITIRRSAGETG